MYKHPVSAFIRLFPALTWVFVCIFVLGTLINLTLYLYTPDRWSDPKQALLEGLFLLGFIGVAVYAAREAYKEYKEALPAVRSDTPIRLGLPFPRQPKPSFTPERYPLPEALRARLSELIEALETAGMLQPGEVTREEVIECAETVDEFSEMGIYEAMNVLVALEWRRKRPFANLAFFGDQVETSEADALGVVREFARLSGQSQHLGSVRVRAPGGGKIVPARRGEFPPENAVVEFQLGAQHCRVPFVMYSKNLPNGLMEGLAKIFVRSDDPRRFVSGYFDSSLSVSYLMPADAAALEEKLKLKDGSPWFEVME